MSVFSNVFSCYLNYTTNYYDFMNYLQSIFLTSYIDAKDPSFISVDFVNKLDQFPKFPFFMNIMSSTDNVRIPDIYNTCLDNPETLLNSILESNVINKKTIYDTIPNDSENLLKQAYFQYTNTSTVDQIYNINKIYRTLNMETSYRNFSIQTFAKKFKLIDESDSALVENGSAIFYYTILCLFINSLPSMDDNLADKLLRYILAYNESYLPPAYSPYSIEKRSFERDFELFITAYTTQIKRDIVKLVTRSIYNYNSITNNLKETLESVVQTKLTSSFNESFINYLNNLPTFEPVFELVSNFYSLLIYASSVEYTAKIVKENSEDFITNQSFINNLITEEDHSYSLFMNKIDSLNIQPYLFLCYIYKFYPTKFLNILQMILQEYTQDIIKTPSEDDSAFTLNIYKCFVDNGNSIGIKDIISYDYLNSFLTTNFTRSELYHINLDRWILYLSCQLYYIQLLDGFLSSQYYTDFISNLLQTIYETLRNLGHADYLFNWYNNHEVVDIYLKTFLRYSIFNGNVESALFSHTTDNFKYFYEKIITNDTGESSYDINIDIKSADDLESHFKNLITSSAINKMYQFNENLILSGLTREIYYAVLGKFFT